MHACALLCIAYVVHACALLCIAYVMHACALLCIAYDVHVCALLCIVYEVVHACALLCILYRACVCIEWRIMSCRNWDRQRQQTWNACSRLLEPSSAVWSSAGRPCVTTPCSCRSTGLRGGNHRCMVKLGKLVAASRSTDPQQVAPSYSFSLFVFFNYCLL